MSRPPSRGTTAPRVPAQGQHGAARLPRLLDPDVDPAAAFGGTSTSTRATGSCRRPTTRPPWAAPVAATVRDLLPLADRPEHPRPRAAGGRRAHADAVRAAHAGSAVPRRQRGERAALDATLRVDRHRSGRADRGLPVAAPDGTPCLEARTPPELEASSACPAATFSTATWRGRWRRTRRGRRWGVETAHPRVLLCGAGARRGGGVSGIPGRAAAMAVLGRLTAAPSAAAAGPRGGAAWQE